MEILLLLIALKFAAGATTCKSGDPAADKLCHEPAVFFKDLDRKWVSENSKNSWFQELGNKVARLHFAELMKGEVLAEDSDFSKLCTKAQFKMYMKGFNTGIMSGHGNNTAHWECKGIEAEPGALDCQFFSDLTKYKDSFKFYVTFSDNKNYYVVVACFPNGEVGWFTHAQTLLTADDKTAITKHMKEIGLSDDSVELYASDCA